MAKSTSRLYMGDMVVSPDMTMMWYMSAPPAPLDSFKTCMKGSLFLVVHDPLASHDVERPACNRLIDVVDVGGTMYRISRMDVRLVQSFHVTHE